MTQDKGHIIGVSLGPGDPELITLKGLNALKNADRIYFPGSQFSDGRIASYSEEILKGYELDSSKWKGFYLEMSLDREQANVVYDQTAEAIFEDWKNGMNVVVVSEGDLSTYSSFSYLLQRLKMKGAGVELIPGITSYAMGAAASSTILGLQNDKMIILPRVQSKQDLEEALKSSKTVILMKIRSVMNAIEEVIEERKCQFVYCERLGTDQQFITSNWEKVSQRTIPYFSLIIIQS